LNIGGLPGRPISSRRSRTKFKRGGIAAWKALRDLLPRDEDIPSSGPSVNISQLFVAAHKEVNRLEKAKTVPPVIDATAKAVTADVAEEEEIEW
jgi:hypothetical protein